MHIIALAHKNLKHSHITNILSELKSTLAKPFSVLNSFKNSSSSVVNSGVNDKRFLVAVLHTIYPVSSP